MNSLRSGERAQANGAAGVFSKLEGEIREVVSRSATAPRVPQQSANELAAGNIGSLLQHVSGTSVQEIEKLIAELQILRDTLQKEADRKSTRLNSSHDQISYAVFCLKKKN